MQSSSRAPTRAPIVRQASCAILADPFSLVAPFRVFFRSLLHILPQRASSQAAPRDVRQGAAPSRTPSPRSMHDARGAAFQAWRVPLDRRQKYSAKNVSPPVPRRLPAALPRPTTAYFDVSKGSRPAPVVGASRCGAPLPPCLSEFPASKLVSGYRLWISNDSAVENLAVLRTAFFSFFFSFFNF